jgi:hypothetical protein
MPKVGSLADTWRLRASASGPRSAKRRVLAFRQLPEGSKDSADVGYQRRLAQQFSFKSIGMSIQSWLAPR